MTLRGYARVLAERWRLIAVFVLVTTAAAVVLTATSPKVYQSSVQIFVATTSLGNSDAQYAAAAFTQTQVQTFASIVASPDVIDKVRADLNLAISDADLKDKLSATAPTGRSIVDLHVQDSSASRSAAIANSAARAFVTVVEGYYAGQGSSGSSGSSSTAADSSGPVRLYVTDPATSPSGPISPKPVLNISLGVLLGLIVGIAVAGARDVLDSRVKDVEVLANAIGRPAMGVIVEDSKAARHPVAARAGRRNLRAENFRQLRANLQFANLDSHPRVIAVTSSVPGEGKTMVATNLAATLAEAGFTVCLVDTDLRRPMIAKTLGLTESVGLTSLLIKEIGLGEALQSAGPRLDVLASGPTPPNPSEVLASTYVRDIVRSLLDDHDYVVLDTAPLLPVADGAEVAALADGTLMVARHRSTNDAQVRRASAALSRVNATIIGVVLNRVPAKDNNEYGYSYYQAEPVKVGKADLAVAGEHSAGTANSD